MTGHEYGIAMFDQHADLLRASGITPEVARQRNYQSVDTKSRLASIDIPVTHRLVPGLLIPVYGPESSNGEAATWQYRPDHPRLDAKGKPVKYVTAMRGLVLDVPVAMRPIIGDPDRPLWITEGIRKVDAAISHGLDCIGVLGVWNWRGTNAKGGTTALGAWEHIALNGRDVNLCFDSDVTVKESVRAALRRFCGFLEYRKAVVRLVVLPDGGDGKTGLDDYLAAGGNVDDLERDGRVIWPSELADFTRSGPTGKPAPRYEPTPVPVEAGLKVFHRWLHLDDDDAILAVAAAVVGNLATGDPCWLLLVAPPSSAKTEIVRAIEPLAYVHMASTVTESALLSGTSTKERAADATGGLLRQVGQFGILCFKDFTSTLAQNKDAAKVALAALREAYDGSWSRAVGSDGGRVLRWDGKVGLVGGVTPSIDRYGQVVTALGDRYLLYRLAGMDDPGRVVESALLHDGDPGQMRRELADAMCGIIAGADLTKVSRPFTESERSALSRFAIYTARARTVVERDSYTGDLLVIPLPEGPGRLALALRRMYGGLEAVGVEPERAWRMLARLASDSVPSVRAKLLGHVARLAEPTKTDTIAESVDMVKRTAERNLEDLSLLGMVERSRAGSAENAAVLWRPTRWLVEHHTGATDKYPPAPITFEEGDFHTPQTALDFDPPTPLRTSLSRYEPPDDDESFWPDEDPEDEL